MKRLTAVLALLALSACGHSRDWEDPKPEFTAVEFRSERPELDASPPESAALQYLAWSVEEDRALGPWVETREAAREQGEAYAETRPGWRWTVIWRQKPDGKPVVHRF